MPSQPPKARIRKFTRALGAHLHGAEPIVYVSLLIVGGAQIVVRERFPNVHPSWPLIGGSLMVVLLCVVLVPPALLLIRLRKNRDPEEQEPQG